MIQTYLNNRLRHLLIASVFLFGGDRLYNQLVRDTGFYQSTAWRKCRDAYFQYKHGLCERCMNPGKIVHHTIYLTLENYNDPNISLNWDYLELLCADCHNKEHFKKNLATREDVKFNENGELVQA